MLKKVLLLLVFGLLAIGGFLYYYYHFRANYIVTIPPQSVLAPGKIKLSERTVPQFDHIAIIVLENKAITAIYNNPNAPYLNSLIKDYASADNYSAVAHPSLPNYLALLGASTYGIESDCTNCLINAPNLTDRLNSAKKSWKAYMDSYPQTSCFLSSRYPYAQKHDPFAYFLDIRNNPSSCGRIVPLDNLYTDLKTLATTPDFIWITPNLCHDMHDCDIAAGDKWLSQIVPQILNSPAFTLQNSVLFITFDESEDTNGSNKVAAIVAGSKIKNGAAIHQELSHYSLVRTIESSWDLAPLTANDAQAPVFSGIYNR